MTNDNYMEMFSDGERGGVPGKRSDDPDLPAYAEIILILWHGVLATDKCCV